MTSNDGSFQFLNVEVRGSSAYLNVESIGKFDGFRRFGILDGRSNYTVISLIDKISSGRVSAQERVVVDDINSNAVITLPANGIVNSSGQTYTGDYNVFLSWINPEFQDLNLRMVGDLSAIDADGELVGLSTFGMLQVELEAIDGSDLNLAEGSSAILEFPLSQQLSVNAPLEIPLWNYDEENGYWLEEGSAFLDDNMYVGEVSHFSTWNVDIKVDPVDICGSIVSGNIEDDLPYFQLELSGNNFQGVGGWLCDDGSFRFLNVPSDQSVTLEVFNYCNEVIETIELGPYDSGKVTLEPIVIDDDVDINIVQVSGNAIDCNDLALTAGVVVIDLDVSTYSFPINPDGSFNVRFPTCGEFQATLQVFNTLDLTASVL